MNNIDYPILPKSLRYCKLKATWTKTTMSRENVDFRNVGFKISTNRGDAVAMYRKLWP